MINPIPTIITPRLKLISLSVNCLKAFLKGDYLNAQTYVNFTVPPECSLLKKPWIKHRLKMIEKDKDQHPWLYRAIVKKSDNHMVGDQRQLKFSPNDN